MQTQEYIDQVLRDIGNSFDEEESRRNRLHSILWRFPNVTPSETWIALPMLFWQGKLDAKILRSMSYEQFLKTPYWLAVSEYVKKHHPWCALCAEPFAEPLEVHHRTYIHRGFEWQHLGDLAVLCHDCHDWISKKPSRQKFLLRGKYGVR